MVDSTPEVSQTEPSTPVNRPLPADRGSHSVPSQHSRRRSIPLPPLVMPGILAQFSQETDSRRSRSRSPARIRTGEVSRSRSRSRNRSISPGNTPIRGRRDSSAYTTRERRRRRSSIITTQDGQQIFDPKYVGAVTVDYLRFFCQVLMEEKSRQISNNERKDKENDRQSLDEDKEANSEDNEVEMDISGSEESVVEPHNEFDHSLQIPSDSDVLHSPISPDIDVQSPLISISQPELGSTSMPQSPIPSTSISQPTKQPFKSYLERILEKQRQKKGTKIVDSPLTYTPNVPESDIETPVVQETERFAINPDVIIESDVNDTPTANESLDFEMEPVFDPEDDNEPGRGSLLNFRDSVVISGNRTPEYSADRILQTNYSPTKLVTPSTSEFAYDYDRAINPESSLSPEGVIHEQYTLNNEDSEAILEHISESEAENDESKLAERYTQTISQPKPTKRIRGSPKKFSESGDIPIGMIKGLVNTTRLQSYINGPARKRKKLDRIPANIHEQIRLFSEEFLQSVVSDLEAYAGHRDSEEIDISDVILYMNRLKGVEQKNESEVENISKLAQNFLPLELLISLDNSLSESLRQHK